MAREMYDEANDHLNLMLEYHPDNGEASNLRQKRIALRRGEGRPEPVK